MSSHIWIPVMGSGRRLILHFLKGQNHTTWQKITLSQFQPNKRNSGNKRTGRKYFQMELSLSSENLSNLFTFLCFQFSAKLVYGKNKGRGKKTTPVKDAVVGPDLIWDSNKCESCFQDSKNWNLLPKEATQQRVSYSLGPLPSGRRTDPWQNTTASSSGSAGTNALKAGVAEGLRSPGGGEGVFHPSIRVCQVRLPGQLTAHAQSEAQFHLPSV